MAARFRSGDGKGHADVTIYSSCSQDSMQAAYIAMAKLADWSDSEEAKEYRSANAGSENLVRFNTLFKLGKEFQDRIIGSAAKRPDWNNKEPFASSTPPPSGIEGFVRGVMGLRFIAPVWAHDNTAKFFYEQGARIWFVRTNQVASPKSDIFPIGPGFN
jgi:predicted Abi (CAAX) family protease